MKLSFKFPVKSLAIGLALFAMLTLNAFAATPEKHYDIQYTKDVVLNPNALDLSSSDSSTTLYNYDGTFSHLIYSSTSVQVSQGDTLYLTGYQQSTNSSYPNLYIQYTFVNKGSNASNPDDDILLTGTKYSSAGSYTQAGSYDFSFSMNSQANDTPSYLRAWNYNNYDGDNKAKTVHIWGSVSR